MAKQVVVTDDITGDAGAETHVLILDGRGVEIDLSPKSVERLVKALAPFWEAGSEGDYQVTRQLGRRQRAAAATNGHRPRLTPDDLVTHIRAHPGGIASRDLADQFGISTGGVAQRLKSRTDVRRQIEQLPGRQGPGTNVWYPA